MLDEALLPQDGRQVRCISCHHIWRQMPDTSSLITAPPLLGLGDMAIEARPPARKRFSWLGSVIFLAIILSLMSIFIFGRNVILTFWPHSERFYDLVGLHVNLPGSGLSLSNTESKVHKEGDIEMVTVTGDVVNISKRVRSIPPLKIKFMGENSHPKCSDNTQGKECVLDYWEHRLSESSLLPGEQIHFETAPRPKSEGTHHISIEF
ncbi:MAG: zinc-ribbon domain-containing protein [Alphaproteobacteria bacterium]|nr:zinc-ribbon domain-containing protein [Alphaproteobacteria bacterium]